MLHHLGKSYPQLLFDIASQDCPLGEEALVLVREFMGVGTLMAFLPPFPFF